MSSLGKRWKAPRTEANLAKWESFTKLSKHGECGTKLYKSWDSMKYRCSLAHKSHKWYFDKGIAVCDEWLEFIPFRDWAKANGYEEGLTLERWNNARGYSPCNCTWIPRNQQARNKSSTWLVFETGITVKEFCTEHEYNYRSVKYRVKRGMSIADAMAEVIFMQARGDL